MALPPICNVYKLTTHHYSHFMDNKQTCSHRRIFNHTHDALL